MFSKSQQTDPSYSAPFSNNNGTPNYGYPPGPPPYYSPPDSEPPPMNMMAPASQAHFEPTGSSSSDTSLSESDLNILFPIPSTSTSNILPTTGVEIQRFEPEPGHPATATLPAPFCLPQITTGFDTPFSRGYNEEFLEKVGVEKVDWLNFVDGLNTVMIASPPLKVVSTVGMVLGFIPYHWAMIAGAAIQASADTAAKVLSKTLTDRFLRRANLAYFKPRGLAVRLIKTPALRQIIERRKLGVGGLTDEDKERKTNKFKKGAVKFGKGFENVVLRLPGQLTPTVIELIHGPPPAVSANPEGVNGGDALARRRVHDLQTYGSSSSSSSSSTPNDINNPYGVPEEQPNILSVDFDNIPPPKKPEGIINQMSNGSVKFKVWMEKRKEKSNNQKRLDLQNYHEGKPMENNGRRGMGGVLGGGGLIGGVIGAVHNHAKGSGGGGDTGGSSSGGGGNGLGGLLGGILGGGLAGQALGGLRAGSGNGGGQAYGGGLRERRGGGRLANQLQGRKLERDVKVANRIEYNKTDDLVWLVVLTSEEDEKLLPDQEREYADGDWETEVVGKEAWDREMAEEMKQEERNDEIEEAVLRAESAQK